MAIQYWGLKRKFHARATVDDLMWWDDFEQARAESPLGISVAAGACIQLLPGNSDGLLLILQRNRRTTPMACWSQG